MSLPIEEQPEEISKGNSETAAPMSPAKVPYRLRALARTAGKIAKHFKGLRQRKAGGTPVRFRSLKEKTGSEFGSGVARGYRRAHARLALSIIMKKAKQ